MVPAAAATTPVTATLVTATVVTPVAAATTPVTATLVTATVVTPVAAATTPVTATLVTATPVTPVAVTATPVTATTPVTAVVIPLKVGDMVTYLGSNARTSFDAVEKRITVARAPNLVESWSLDGRGSYVSTQPIVVNGVVYWGDYNGYEHATSAATGKDLWSRYLGSYYAGSSGNPTYCTPDQMGVVGSPAVADVSGRVLLFVPGGGSMSGTSGALYFFALDASTGQVVWQTGVGNAPADTLWSSPALYKGSIYEGVAGQGGCPNHTASRLLKLDAATGASQASLTLVPDGCTGGDVWGSPTIDEAAGTVYIATGDQDNRCLGKEPDAQAVVEVSAADFKYIGSWHLFEASDMDHDFGSTPTLFTGGGRPLVGVVNKNGIFYAFARDHLSAGPVWTYKVASPGLASPEVGDGSVSPAAWDGATLYVAGGTSVNKKCQGTLEALHPDTGKVKWSDCLPGFVLPAVVAAPGIVVVGASSHLMVINANTGAVLWKWLDPRGTPFWSAPTIANGVLYAANSGWAEPGRSWGPGRLYAFTVGSHPVPTPTAVPSVCPRGWSCLDIGSPSVPASDVLRNGTWTVISGGGDIWGTGDQFHFDYTTVRGDTDVSAQVSAQSYSDPWAKAGVMLRADTAAGAAFYDALVTPSNGIVVQYRSSQGAEAIQIVDFAGAVPTYLKVTRTGTSFSAYTSADGAAWTLLKGSSVTLKSLGGRLLAGLAITAHNLIDPGMVRYHAVSIRADEMATATPTPAVEALTRTPAPHPGHASGTPTVGKAKSSTPTPDPGKTATPTK